MPWSWDDVLNLPWKEIGHGALDVAGFVPGIGEAADLANACLYAAEGDYLNAGLSLISVIPVVGDVIGKGGKLISKLGPDEAARVLEAVQKMDIPKYLEGFKNHPELGPYVARMQEALKKWQDDLRARFGKKDAGRAKEDCPKAPKKSHKERLREKLGDYIDTLCEAMCKCKGKGNQKCVAQQLSSGGHLHATKNATGKLLVETPYRIPSADDPNDVGSLIRSETNRQTPGGAPAPASLGRALSRGKELGKGNTVRWDFVLVKDPKKAAEFDNIERIIEMKFGEDRWTPNQKTAAKRLGKKFGEKIVYIRDSHCECG